MRRREKGGGIRGKLREKGMKEKGEEEGANEDKGEEE